MFNFKLISNIINIVTPEATLTRQTLSVSITLSSTKISSLICHPLILKTMFNETLVLLFAHTGDCVFASLTQHTARSKVINEKTFLAICFRSDEQTNQHVCHFLFAVDFHASMQY